MAGNKHAACSICANHGTVLMLSTTAWHYQNMRAVHQTGYSPRQWRLWQLLLCAHAAVPPLLLSPFAAMPTTAGSIPHGTHGSMACTRVHHHGCLLLLRLVLLLLPPWAVGRRRSLPRGGCCRLGRHVLFLPAGPAQGALPSHVSQHGGSAAVHAAGRPLGPWPQAAARKAAPPDRLQNACMISQ